MPAIPIQQLQCGKADLDDKPSAVATSAMAQLAPIQPRSEDARREVDFLVKEIKENLKLGHFYPSAASSGGGKLRSSRSVPSHLSCHRSTHRSSPYAVPPCSRMAGNENVDIAEDDKGIDKAPSQLRRWNQRRRYPSTCMPSASKDPDDPFQMLQELITDGSLIKEAVRRLQLGLTPKYAARSHYDSDEECRTPQAYPELCCEI